MYASIQHNMDMNPSTIFTLRIELLDIEPVIFRQVLVPSSITLPKLHQTIQAVMSWEDQHLYAFEFDGVKFSPPGPFPELDLPGVRSTQRQRLSQALGAANRFLYTYDFGDDWRHLVTLQDIAATDIPMKHPICLSGANACPPEDVGGVPGYMEFTEAMAHPAHASHADMLCWHGALFDPTRFDPEAAQQQLRKIRL